MFYGHVQTSVLLVILQCIYNITVFQYFKKAKFFNLKIFSIYLLFIKKGFFITFSLKDKVKIHASPSSQKSDTYTVPLSIIESRKTSQSSISLSKSEIIMDKKYGKRNSFTKTELIHPLTTPYHVTISPSSKPDSMTPPEI